MQRNNQKLILKKLSNTAASNPTMCSMSISFALMVGLIQEKKPSSKPGAAGEKPANFVLGANRAVCLLLNRQKAKKDKAPIVRARKSCCSNHGPSKSLPLGSPGGAEGEVLGDEEVEDSRVEVGSE